MNEKLSPIKKRMAAILHEKLIEFRINDFSIIGK